VLASNPAYVEYESGCRVLESVATRKGGDAARAIVAAQRALALEAGRAGVPAREIDAAEALATALAAASRYADADAAFQRVAAMLDAQGLGDTRLMAVVLNNWSAMLQNSGQLVKGAEVAARAVATARATDSENGASLSMLTTYGVALSSTGAHADAAAIFDEALVKARAAGSPTRLITALSTAISAAANAGDVERATRLLAEANAALPAAKSAYSRGIVEAASARVALAADDRVRALEWARRAVSTLETATPSQTSLVATRPLLARTLNANGEHAEALRIAEQSLASAQGVRHPGQTHTANIGLALLEVAGARHGLGETAAARESIARALEHLNATFGPRAAVTHRAEQLRQQIVAK
jgi:tetratricopeptide (TPR) repeat protein